MTWLALACAKKSNGEPHTTERRGASRPKGRSLSEELQVDRIAGLGEHHLAVKDCVWRSMEARTLEWSDEARRMCGNSA